MRVKLAYPVGLSIISLPRELFTIYFGDLQKYFVVLVIVVLVRLFYLNNISTCFNRHDSIACLNK